jgi:uncharacterized membrane protein YqjE
MINDPAKSAGGTLGQYAYRDDRGDRSIGDVLKDIFGNVQEMIRSEIRLARVEMREEAGKTLSSAQMMAVGGVIGLFAVGFVLVAIAQALAMVMPGWAASLVMGIVLGLIGVALLASGKKHLRAPTPNKTIENVKENVEWMKNQTK